MGSTLIKYDSEPEEIFRRVLDSMGISRSVDEMRKAFSKTEQEFRNVHQDYLLGKIPSKKYWIKWNSTVLKHLKLPHNEKFGKQIQDKWFDYFKWTAYPDAEKTLKKLRQRGMKTGLVTTAYEAEIDIILRGAGLQREYFDVVVGADTVKYVKPHPNVFRHALAQLEMRPEETVFVACMCLLEVDYKPAETVGMQAILIQRGNHNGQKEESIWIIKNLEEIFKCLNQ